MFHCSSARRSRGSAVVLAGLLLLVAVASLAADTGGAPYAGRSVQDVLRELGKTGLNFIYNTQQLPAGLTVTAEPSAAAPLEIAREILAAHGLALLSAGEGAYAVVQDKTPPKDARGVTRGRTADPAGAGAAEAEELPQIVVTTSSYALAHNQSETHMFLTRAELEALPKLADEPLRAVQRLPGSAAGGYSAQSHIRGGEYDEVLMVLDGLPLNEPFHLKNFQTPVSVFDARSIGSMDVYSGGFTANYGDRMSGVIDITSLSPPEDRYTELGVTLFHSSVLSAGRFGDDRGQWLASIRRSNLDFVANAINSQVGEPEYFDAIGRVSWALSDSTTLFATALTSRDEVDANTSDDTQRVEAEYQNTYLWGGWQQDWSSRLSSRLILALTDLDNGRDGTIDQPGDRFGALHDHRSLRMGIARLDFTHEAERLYTRFGVEARNVDASYRYQSSITYEPDFPFPGDPGSTVTRDLAPAPDGHQYSAYVTSRALLAARLNAELGLRWDAQTYAGTGTADQLSPRVNLMFDVTPKTRLRAAWGRFWQSQSANELQVEDGVDTFYRAQQADHLIISVEQALPREINLRVEAYEKDYDRVRPHYENLFDPLKLLPELEPDRVQVAPEHSRARGVELLLARRSTDPWSWWLSYAWSRVTDQIDGNDVARSWDQRNTINAGLGYSGEHWELTFTDTYHTGWPTTDMFLTPAPGGGSEVTVGARNAARYNDYNSLDFRLLRRFALPDSSLEAFFEVSNVFAERNACCTDLEVSGEEGAPVIEREIDDWPRIIPSFGVLWKF